jgi:SAM-dependent methyltransferase
LFDALADVLGRRVLEIGCGTGQATLPLAKLGHAITAVELGAEMAAVARRKLAAFPQVQVVVSTFEDWPLPELPFDSVFAATAFNWVDPAVRMTKAADALKPGGTLAVVSTDHIAGGSERLFVDVQRCYERFDPTTPPGLRLLPAAQLPQDSGEFDRSGRFGPVRFARFEWEHEYTTAEYLDLLSTYSGHRAMATDARAGLFRCIAALIDGQGGRIAKRYLTQLAWSDSK